MSPVERLIATAQAEIGYVEKGTNAHLDDKTANAGANNYTKYARDLDAMGDIYNGKKNGYDWCDVFVDWCFIVTFGKELGMKLLCQAYKGLGAGCKYSAQYYRQKGQFHTTDPRPGDQIFFGSGSTWSHTGLVVDVKGGKVYTIEGNSGAKANKVGAYSYAIGSKNIQGYGRPDWSLVPPEEEEDAGMTKEELLAILAEFEVKIKAELAALKAELTQPVFDTVEELPKWARAEIRACVDRGIIKGVGGDKLGLTMQDVKAAIMALRAAKGGEA